MPVIHVGKNDKMRITGFRHAGRSPIRARLDDGRLINCVVTEIERDLFNGSGGWRVFVEELDG